MHTCSLLTTVAFFWFRLHEEQDEPSSPIVASVPLIHNIPELKVSQQVIHYSFILLHAFKHIRHSIGNYVVNEFLPAKIYSYILMSCVIDNRSATKFTFHN